MPNFTLHRNHTLRSTKGHTITFVKGEPVWVPPVCVPEAVAIGAVPQETIPDVLGAEAAPVVQMTLEDRDAAITKAFEFLLSRNERGDFNASGLPSIKKVSDIVGFDVTNSMRDQAWMAYTASKTTE